MTNLIYFTFYCSSNSTLHYMYVLRKMRNTLFFITILIVVYNIEHHRCEEFCYSSECNAKNRFLFYDVNPSEGFNLRRDVYMRFAVLAKRLRESKNDYLRSFKLVLPPWSHLIHWHHSAFPEHIPWSVFFDLPSLQLFAPVIEMHQFFAISSKYTKIKLDEVYVLQHFTDMFETGNFEDRSEIQTCQRHQEPNYFYYNNLTSTNVKCLSFHGAAINIIKLLLKSSCDTVMFDHGEVALHYRFGDKEYWMARRSMRFSKPLIQIAAEYRAQFLNSTDSTDGTMLPESWLLEHPHRNASGGPYLAVHLRRRDFAIGRPQQVPSIADVGEQSNAVLKKLGIDVLFIATDASEQEYSYLKSLIHTEKVFRYLPIEDAQLNYGDGGTAIIDQIICSHARYFIGTQDSTFSLRIQEEREIMGFPVETTFNSFCKSGNLCEKPAVWKVVY